MDFIIKALQLILSLSILVILHECGHFFFAKLFKVKVEKFYLFFNPWFSLFKFKKGDTEYGIGWLPLGGYVKIAGMIDESMDKEQLAKPPQSWEFRSHPAWQRLLIMVGGVLVNVVAAIVIFWLILFKWGEAYIPAENAKYGFAYHPIANEIGLHDGDRVLKVDTFIIDNVNDIGKYILLDGAKAMTVVRGDSVFDVQIPDGFALRMVADKVKAFADYRFPNIVDSVVPQSNAAKGGLLKNDSIVMVNGAEMPYFHNFTAELTKHKSEKVNIGVYRNGQLVSLSLDVDANGKVGFGPKSPADILGYRTIEYGFLEAFPAGVSKGMGILVSYVKQFKLVFTREGAKQLGGFGTIGSLYPAFWDWHTFWFTTAFLSLILAFMNILPIPALDGGHVMFLLYEMITGRKPSDKFLEHAQIIGMLLLLALLLYANGNDVVRWITSR
ncbi:MAG: RIP metalloprotease RseP [Cytophagaceae bacterium]|jgi:regulator of sigma E protease|nr:RIP metalloprotease RseP [Cytophagaceae bacterium]